MAKPLRVEYPGAFYHVINRGKEKFLEYLEKATGRFSIVIHTYCLMSNPVEYTWSSYIAFIGTQNSMSKWCSGPNELEIE